ncbi:MAG: hypothetical protein RIC80_08730 [Cyclobacteriaceae bacterium]
MATPINEDGKFIDVAVAKKEIDDYMQHLRDEGKDPTKMALGHVYGLDRINQLMEFMKNYNSGDPKQPIEGVRLYLGWNSNSPNPDKTDLVFMPITKDGKDLYPVYSGKEPEEEQDGGNILAEGDPCPIWCHD